MTVRNFKVIDCRAPSLLEQEYVELYGEELVEDLKQAYCWMRQDMLKQPPLHQVVERRKQSPHNLGDWISVSYVDFQNEDLYTQTIDDMGGKTIYNDGSSPCLQTDENRNLHFLLSGLYLFNKEKAIKWRDKFLGGDAKIWFEAV